MSGRLIEEEDRATGSRRPILWGASTVRKNNVAALCMVTVVIDLFILRCAVITFACCS